LLRPKWPKHQNSGWAAVSLNHRVDSQEDDGKDDVTTNATAVEGKAAKIAQIAETVETHKGKPGSLIQALHQAQQIYGYLPLEVQEVVADGLDVPLSEVTGVVSFYSFFSTVPRGEHVIRICMGTACYVRGGKSIVDHLSKTLAIEPGGSTDDGQFSLEVARCIGACGLAPAVLVDDTVYRQVSESGMDKILTQYKEGEQGSA